MKSFYLAKGGSAKKQALSAGGIMLVLGIVGLIFFGVYGLIISVVGLILVLASAFASE